MTVGSLFNRPQRTMYTCNNCGTGFKSYNKSPKFCSKKCKDESNMIVLDESLLRDLYLDGLTQHELANEFNVTQKVVWANMKRYGISARTATKRDQRGEKNHMWKGDDASYAAFHYRVSGERGNPKECSVCGTTDENASYDWANLTGNYGDTSDYARMCRSCHRQYDKRRPGVRHASEKRMTVGSLFAGIRSADSISASPAPASP